MDAYLNRIRRYFQDYLIGALGEKLTKEDWEHTEKEARNFWNTWSPVLSSIIPGKIFPDVMSELFIVDDDFYDEFGGYEQEAWENGEVKWKDIKEFLEEYGVEVSEDKIESDWEK